MLMMHASGLEASQLMLMMHASDLEASQLMLMMRGYGAAPAEGRSR